MWSLRSNVILASLEMCRYSECGGFASLAEGHHIATEGSTYSTEGCTFPNEVRTHSKIFCYLCKNF